MNVSRAEEQRLLSVLAVKIRASYVLPERADCVAAKLDALVAGTNAMDAHYTQANLSLFCEQITNDLRLWSDDGHLRVSYSKKTYVQPADDAVVREQSDRQLRCQRMGMGIAQAEIRRDNVGYIDIREFVELSLSREFISAAMLLMAYCDALIVDLRECVGGDPATVAWMASALFDQRTQLSRLEPRNAPCGSYSLPAWSAPALAGSNLFLY